MFVLILIIIIIIILLILLIFSKKNYENYHINSPGGVTDCIVVSTIVDKIQSQLDKLFVSSNQVGPITITLSNGETYIGPPISSFTQSIDPSFKFLNPSSDTVTILNNTWGYITLYEGDSKTPFSLQLNGTQKDLQSGTVYPTCSQEYVKVTEFTLSDFFFSGLSNIQITADNPPTCSVISRKTKSSYPIRMYTYNFSFICENVEFGCNISANGCECSNYCVLLTPCVTCSCYGNNYENECCAHNPHQICPPDSEWCQVCANITNGYVHIASNLELPLILQFTYQINKQNGSIEITDISINKNTDDISWTSVNITFNTGTSIDLANVIIDALGGVPVIKDMINDIADQVINKLLENVINMINDILKTETISID